ncbi:MAG TPA: helix-turn-helix transcriptional regulator [Opitutaceae bacterium]|nr:helix-turn-helix transcriptional regulator [Opitutaceae bacterium]
MPNDIAKRLLARVRELREARGLSQEAFAELAGLKYKHYQAIEAGRKINIQLLTLQKLAKASGLELWELLNFDVSPSVLAEDAPHPERVRSSRRRRKG